MDKIDLYDEKDIWKCVNKIDEYIVCVNNYDKVLGFAGYGLNKKGYNYGCGEVYSLYVDDKYRCKKV